MRTKLVVHRSTRAISPVPECPAGIFPGLAPRAEPTRHTPTRWTELAPMEPLHFRRPGVMRQAHHQRVVARAAASPAQRSTRAAPKTRHRIGGANSLDGPRCARTPISKHPPSARSSSAAVRIARTALRRQPPQACKRPWMGAAHPQDLRDQILAASARGAADSPYRQVRCRTSACARRARGRRPLRTPPHRALPVAPESFHTLKL